MLKISLSIHALYIYRSASKRIREPNGDVSRSPLGNYLDNPSSHVITRYRRQLCPRSFAKGLNR